ncbi:hypothetical protein NQ314_018965 [Rhamnusium bicolor]|uniref:Uncharacterized protein n=1 Tax=Rhamnusium bicolor TaxID=1586634 RepID=A0AAV8WPM6_9CUCU|nr:hypothetical protein NQ314_018965 [Rhamnusium bicolor]
MVVYTPCVHTYLSVTALKVKLLLRRPFDQLVAQGIMPPHKTPAAFHGQRRQLERAKTGDMLKAKIQQRPPRQELERRHILEADPNHVDPSLAERQRMLKKARLADQLNDQLSHRPGPLELIRKNILHTEEPIEQAVKTGRIPYKATSEGQLNRPQLPSNYINPEEDSQSSEGDNTVSPGPSDVLETAAKSAGIVVSLIQPTEGTVVLTTATPVLHRDNSEIVFADLCRSVAAPLLTQASASSPASLVSSTSTLSPLSSIASPVPSVKSSNATPDPEESSYDLLLKQQTLLLQFQLQLQHKYPQIILPASQKATASESNNNHLNHQQPSPAPSTSSESSTPARIIGRLEDMKELGSPLDSLKDDQSEHMELDPMSPAPQQMQDQFQQHQIQQHNQEISQKTKEDIVREQQRQIEELQRELTLSQLKLQAATRSEPKAQMIALQKHLQARQQQQQQQNFALQMKQLQALQARQAQVNEEQQRIQQQQHVAFQNQKNIAGGLVFNSADAAIVFNQLMQGKAKVLNGHTRANSSPNFLNSIVTPIIAAPEIKTEYNEDMKSPPEIKIEFNEDKILIKNGELPPSAANDPSTPGSASTKTTEPVYPPPVQNNINCDSHSNSTVVDPNSPEAALGLDPTDLLESLDNLDNMDFSQLVMELGGCQTQSENNNMQNDQTDNEQMVPMDTDDWLESLLPSENIYNGNNGSNTAPLATQETDLGGYDPLLGINQDPFDPFNLEEFRSPADLTASLSWDKVDYAA